MHMPVKSTHCVPSGQAVYRQDCRRLALDGGLRGVADDVVKQRESGSQTPMGHEKPDPQAAAVVGDADAVEAARAQWAGGLADASTRRPGW